jgi:SAM-dependent methyltransferase
MSDYSYIGDELELFARAKNWKAYWAHQISPFISGNVAEVGTGVGSNTALLLNDKVHRWFCVEPDAKLVEALKANLHRNGALDSRIQIITGALADCEESARFDSIIYIDVIEHIEDDAKELSRASSKLNPGGFLVVLSPAHQWLFSEFDARIGHFRRYTKKTILAVSPPDIRLHRLRYLDSCGLAASLANRMLLHQKLPNPQQIAFWDGKLVPVSRIIDKLAGYGFGKSILAVWQKR